jgi:hypothetical protein
VQGRLNEVLFANRVDFSGDDTIELVIHIESYLEYLSRQIEEYDDLRIEIVLFNDDRKPNRNFIFGGASTISQMAEAMKDMSSVFMKTGATVEQATNAFAELGGQMGKIHTITLDYVNVLR